MVTVNFSLPDEVKAAFDRAFEGQNKNAVIAECMRKAVEGTKQRKRREEIFRILTRRREERPQATDEAIAAARSAGRP